MADRDHENTREDLPGPQEDRDTGTTGSTDERSSENRRKGLQKDRENMQGGEGTSGDEQE